MGEEERGRREGTENRQRKRGNKESAGEIIIKSGRKGTEG